MLRSRSIWVISERVRCILTWLIRVLEIEQFEHLPFELEREKNHNALSRSIQNLKS